MFTCYLPLFVVDFAVLSNILGKIVPSLRHDTRGDRFLKKTWENSSKTLKYVFLRFDSDLCVKFTANSFNLVNYNKIFRTNLNVS